MARKYQMSQLLSSQARQLVRMHQKKVKPPIPSVKRVKVPRRPSGS